MDEQIRTDVPVPAILDGVVTIEQRTNGKPLLVVSFDTSRVDLLRELRDYLTAILP